MLDDGYPSQIDECRVIRLLGSGGSGGVYLVEHPRLARRDPLKLLVAMWDSAEVVGDTNSCRADIHRGLVCYGQPMICIRRVCAGLPGCGG